MEFKCICGKEFKNAISLGAHTANCKLAKDEKQKKLKILKIEEENYNCICNCGRKFKTIKSLNSHARFCVQYVKKKLPTIYYNSNTSTYNCECGYIATNSQSLNAHFSHCKIHREINEKDNSSDYWNKRNHIGEMSGWNKFTDDEKKEIHNKSINTIKEKHKNGENISFYKGHEHSKDTKILLSNKRKINLENGIGNHWICPNIKRSYAEQYFYDYFKNNTDLDIQNNIWVDHYCLDFVLDNYYFEVDGEQHYQSEEAIKNDQRRYEYLQKKGYILIDRCRWKNFYKLSKDEKISYMDNIIKMFSLTKN